MSTSVATNALVHPFLYLYSARRCLHTLRCNARGNAEPTLRPMTYQIDPPPPRINGSEGRGGDWLLVPPPYPPESPDSHSTDRSTERWSASLKQAYGMHERHWEPCRVASGSTAQRNELQKSNLSLCVYPGSQEKMHDIPCASGGTEATASPSGSSTPPDGSMHWPLFGSTAVRQGRKMHDGIPLRMPR